MPIIVQQDATMYSLFISVNGCTRFGWYLHPSSGAHVTVATASGISETVTATCNLSWTWLEGNYSCSCGFTNANDDGWRYHPKHVERFTDINKLYIVASCWTIIGICLWLQTSHNVLRILRNLKFLYHIIFDMVRGLYLDMTLHLLQFILWSTETNEYLW